MQFFKGTQCSCFLHFSFFANKIWSGRSPGSNQPRCVSISECIAAKISKYSLIDVSQNWAESNSITKCLGSFMKISISDFSPPFRRVWKGGRNVGNFNRSKSLGQHNRIVRQASTLCWYQLPLLILKHSKIFQQIRKNGATLSTDVSLKKSFGRWTIDKNALNISPERSLHR